ncbi:MAG TPA: LPS export ABC transporter permease LptF [Gammaproteobacteria bacterium]|nr:LPS export ABC transporter permease LptF [Gammaproteobacteria bacterium]
MIIQKYLTKEVMRALTVVISVLMLAFLSQQMVRYLNYVAIGKIPTNVLLELVSFEIPYLLALLLPLALYLGVLLAYGRMYADQEMAILSMSGFNNWRLLRVTSVMALFISTFVLILMLWVNPMISLKRQEVMNSDEATLHMIETLMPGRFQVSPDGNHVMYVESLSRDHKRAHNVFIAQQKPAANDADAGRWSVIFAEQGFQKKFNQIDEPFFVTLDGYRYEGAPGENDYKIIKYKTYAIRIPQNDARLIHPESEAMSVSALWGDYSNPRRAAELQWRISIALSAMILALFAAPLSAVRPRKSRFFILLPAVIVYIIYFNLLVVARHWVEVGRFGVGMWWVHAVMLSAVLILVFIRSRQWN